MRRVVIDTNVYSRGLAGERWSAAILRQAEEILLCPIVVGELFTGFRNGARESRNRALFERFVATSRVTVVNISVETSEFYSSVLGQLRRQGTPIPTNDIWIAACAMEHGAHVATLDAHFKRVAGLLCVFPENEASLPKARRRAHG